MRAAAVVPAGDAGPLLDGCLQALRAQARPLDEIVVVDDTPGGRVGDLDGVRVLRSGGRGPYAARNVGWRATDADVVLFLDLRSRPHPSYAGRLLALFDDPGVALAGTDVRILGGRTLGARLAERQQFYALEKYTTEAFFRPYLPTCNLAARRADIEAVGGFREVRSGADADFCWRVADRPGRRLETVPEVLMDWVPRERLRGFFEQSYRYGGTRWALRRAWAEHGAPASPPMPASQIARRMAGIAVRGTLAAARRREDDLLEELTKAGRYAFRAGYRVAAARDGIARSTTRSEARPSSSGQKRSRNRA